MQSEKNSNSNNRVLYFDVLRVIATIGVIIIHVYSPNTSTNVMNTDTKA